MKKIVFFILLPFITLYSLQAQIAVKAGKIYTSAGETINEGIVLIRDGKFEKIGSAASVKIPAGYAVYEAKCVTPGLVDARSEVSLSGGMN